MPTTSLSDAKITGLRQVLARDGQATLKNGMRIVRDPEWPADLLVCTADGDRRRVNEFAHDQLRQAYALALAGPPPPPAPPPQVFKPTRSKRDFGECPF